MSKANEGPVSVDDPVLALNIIRTYKVGMSPKCTMECARGVWKLSPAHARDAKYVLAVADGIIREVYVADRWDDAGTTPYTWRKLTDEDFAGRFEFVGRVAPQEIRDKYVDRRLALVFGQNPVRYINC